MRRPHSCQRASLPPAKADSWMVPAAGMTPAALAAFALAAMLEHSFRIEEPIAWVVIEAFDLAFAALLVGPIAHACIVLPCLAVER